MVLTFLGWLIMIRGVCPVIISKYLLGWRTAHLRHGSMPGTLRPDTVAVVIKGKDKEEAMLPKKVPWVEALKH